MRQIAYAPIRMSNTLWATREVWSVGATRLTTLRRASRKYIGLSATRMNRMLGEEIG